MAEYIERIALLEHLAAYCLDCDGCGEARHCVATAPAADVVKRERWISVEERLPTESGGTVLVCMPDVFPHNQKEPFVNAKRDRRVKIGHYSEHSKRWYYGDMMSIGGTDPVAWMPLPEPPEGGAEAPKPMTNRDYINSLSNEELITWVLYDQQEIGKAYTHSELALIDWLNKPYTGRC